MNKELNNLIPSFDINSYEKVRGEAKIRKSIQIALDNMNYLADFNTNSNMPFNRQFEALSTVAERAIHFPIDSDINASEIGKAFIEYRNQYKQKEFKNIILTKYIELLLNEKQDEERNKEIANNPYLSIIPYSSNLSKRIEDTLNCNNYKFNITEYFDNETIEFFNGLIGKNNAEIKKILNNTSAK